MEGVREAPCFRPTWEQFQEPMKYIESIREEAEAAGICKIVPPQGWKPPFAVDTAAFRFRTRAQNLCKVDGQARVEREFTTEVRKYLFRRGAAMGSVEALPVLPSGAGGALEPLRVFRLYTEVEKAGGMALVTAAGRWEDVARGMLPAVKEASEIRRLSKVLERAYRQYLMAFTAERMQHGRGGRASKRRAEEPMASEASGDTGSVTGAAGAEMPTFASDSKELAELALAGCGAGEQGATAARAALEGLDAAISAARGAAKDAVKPTLSHEVVETIHVPGKPVQVSRKKRRGRPANPEKAQKRQVMSCQTLKVKRRRLCESIGKPRSPEIVLGATFFKYYQDANEIFQGRVMSHDPQTRRYEIEYVRNSADGTHWHNESVGEENLLMLLSSGETEKLAQEALVEGICQQCLRADKGNKLLLCDGCNSSYHISCLEPPLLRVPRGDWFCESCIESDDEENRTDPGGSDAGGGDEDLGVKMSKGAAGPENEAPQNGTSGLPEHFLRVLAAFGFEDGNEYTLEDYRAMAEAFRDKYLAKARRGHNPNVEAYLAQRGTERGDLALEREYWRLVSHAARCDPELVELKVSYGSDLDTGKLGSGFPGEHSVEALQRELSAAPEDSPQRSMLAKRIKEHQRYVRDGWNLSNFPKLPGSLLQYVDEDITGVIVPWLYMGMFFSSFCWHTEDHYFASINYHHWGEPKTWYGVPSTGAAAFEQAARKMTPELFEARPDILTGIVTQFNPSVLAREGVPVYHIIQRPGDFVITFPQAYHGGFNHGLNCAEAVNFATERWLPFGESCVQRYADLRKNPVISHEALVASLSSFSVSSAEQSNQLSHAIYPRLAKMILDEKAARAQSEQSLPGLQVVPYSDIIREHEAQQKQAAASKAGEANMSRMGAAAQHSMSRIDGRERSHMSRMGRMAPGGMSKAPGEKGWLVQVQCHDCNRFCSLSFIHAISQAPSADSAETRYRFYCHRHARERFAKPGARRSSKDVPQLEMVVVWPLERLVELRGQVARAGLRLAYWRRKVFEAMQGKPRADLLDVSPDKVAAQEPDEKVLIALAGMSADSPGSYGLAPGALYTLSHAGGRKVTVSKLKELLTAAAELSLDPESAEVSAVQALALLGETVQQAFQDIATARGADDPKAWPSLASLRQAVSDAQGASTVDLRRSEHVQAGLQLLEKAESWLADYEKVMQRGGADDDLDELEERFESDIRLSAVSSFAALQRWREARGWVETAKSMARFGCKLSEARQHLAALPDAPEAMQTERDARTELMAVIKEAAKVERRLLQTNGNPQHLVAAFEACSSLKAVPAAAQDAVKARVARIVEFEKRLASILPSSDASRGSSGKGEGGNGAVRRAKEEVFVKLRAQGLDLGYNVEDSPLFNMVCGSLERVRHWRAKLLDSSLQRIPAAQSSATRQVQAHEALEVLLRMEAQGISRGLRQVPGNPVMFADAARQAGTDALAVLQVPQSLEPPTTDAAGNKLFCLCRQPNSRDEFMVACDGCSEWYHPQCLATTRSVVESMSTFYCPTCIHDGKTPARQAARPGHCWCGTSAGAQDHTRIKCTMCKGAFHPLCVGMSPHEAQMLQQYCCPMCSKKLDVQPIINLFCLCRRAEFGTSGFDSSMICCDQCQDWLHPVCIGLSAEGVAGLLAEGRKYYCKRCCVGSGVPYVNSTGACGYAAMRADYLSMRTRARLDRPEVLIKGTDEAARLTELPRLPQMRALLDEVDSFACIVAEEKHLRSIADAAYTWVSLVSRTDITTTPTLSLWAAAAQQVRLSCKPSPGYGARIQAELWLRYLESLCSLGPGAFESYPVPAVQPSLRHLSFHSPPARLLRSVLEAAPGVVQHVVAEANRKTTRGQLTALFLRAVQNGG